jgi:hypothetical protein
MITFGSALSVILLFGRQIIPLRRAKSKVSRRNFQWRCSGPDRGQRGSEGRDGGLEERGGWEPVGALCWTVLDCGRWEVVGGKRQAAGKIFFFHVTSLGKYHYE